jgi:hypothetical protein
LEGLAMEDVGVFLRSFGIFSGHLRYFMKTWYILW